MQEKQQEQNEPAGRGEPQEQAQGRDESQGRECLQQEQQSRPPEQQSQPPAQQPRPQQGQPKRSRSSRPQQEQPKRYRAVCFDLDGTLLPMDLELFMGGYFSALGRFVAERGIDQQVFLGGIKAGSKAMAVSGEDVSNEEAFWAEMFKHVDRGAQDWPVLLEEFYRTDFAVVGKDAVPDPAAARAVKTLREKGYTLALTTMPMFPPVATAERLRWAQVDAADFARISTYDNSRSVKPCLTYYAENLAALGLRGEDVLMVGNNTVEDLAILELGADAYLVTDNLIDPLDYDLSTIKHGSMADFAAWAETLPVCESPAGPVETGLIDAETIHRVLEENAAGAFDPDEARRKAAAAVDDPTYERAKKEK